MQTDDPTKLQEKNKLSLDDLLREKREQILEIATQHGAYNVRVFGSAAKGIAGPDGDLDLLVDVNPEHSARFPAGLILDLGALLDREVDVVAPDALHRYIRDRVLAEAVPLCGTIDSTWCISSSALSASSSIQRPDTDPSRKRK